MLMDRFVGCFLFFLLISVSASYAAVPAARVYWEKVLPHVSMPNAIRDLIRDDFSVDNTVDINNSNQQATQIGVSSSGVHVSTDKGKSVNVTHKGVVVNTTPKGRRPIIVNVNPFFYMYAAKDTQIHDDPRVAYFFLEKDLHLGSKMKLNFAKTSPTSAFIAKTVAESIPFSSSKLPEILKRFKINPKALESGTMKKTLKECELPAMKGESKYCATSLESMIEFSIKSLGTRDIKAMSTAVAKNEIGEKEYMIKKNGVEKTNVDKLVACHLEEYKYAVFYCHVTTKSKVYTVKMVARDRANVEAVAVCHTDTAAWNPRHVAFRVLGVKPGTVPVCHFLPQDHVVWARNY